MIAEQVTWHQRINWKSHTCEIQASTGQRGRIIIIILQRTCLCAAAAAAKKGTIDIWMMVPTKGHSISMDFQYFRCLHLYEWHTFFDSLIDWNNAPRTEHFHKLKANWFGTSMSINLKYATMNTTISISTSHFQYYKTQYVDVADGMFNTFIIEVKKIISCQKFIFVHASCGVDSGCFISIRYSMKYYFLYLLLNVWSFIGFFLWIILAAQFQKWERHLC